MWYKNALNIGDAEGTVQCSYAVLYEDPKGEKPLFCFRRKHFELSDFVADLHRNNAGNYSFDPKWADSEDEVANYTGWGREILLGWDDNRALREPSVYATIDFPLVIAKEYSSEKLVPVRILGVALAYLKQSLMYAKLRNYSVAVNSAGEVVEMHLLGHKAGDDKWYARCASDPKLKGCKIIDKTDISPRYLKIREMLSEDRPFYVKPAAFFWHPVNDKNTRDENGNVTNEQIKALKADLDRARMLLILAGGAAVVY